MNSPGFDIDYSEVIALENQEDFLVDVADKYLEWALLVEQIKNSKRAAAAG